MGLSDLVNKIYYETWVGRNMFQPVVNACDELTRPIFQGFYGLVDKINDAYSAHYEKILDKKNNARNWFSEKAYSVYEWLLREPYEIIRNPAMAYGTLLYGMGKVKTIGLLGPLWMAYALSSVVLGSYGIISNQATKFRDYRTSLADHTGARYAPLKMKSMPSPA
ncbi:MAG: hypothetical protein KKF44_06405 [Nanoarchaeota archaeon]|nr:hypothetical protein [Nanoarchaeota archaeon]